MIFRGLRWNQYIKYHQKEFCLEGMNLDEVNLQAAV